MSFLKFKTWIAGTRPAMTGNDNTGVVEYIRSSRMISGKAVRLA
jgi:hypothetical protein